VQSFFFVRHEGKFVKVEFREIVYIESRKNYSRLVLEDRPAMLVLITLKQWEKLLPGDLFCRIHRAYIVSLAKIVSFDNRRVCLPGEQIAIGELYRHSLPSAVTILVGESSRERPPAGQKEAFSELAG
jgi:hypothetical protein